MTPTPWTERELAAVKEFSDQLISATEFIERFLRARSCRFGAAEDPGLRTEDFLDEVFYAVDSHNKYDDLRSPDELDDGQLTDVVSGLQHLWESGSFQPDR